MMRGSTQTSYRLASRRLFCHERRPHIRLTCPRTRDESRAWGIPDAGTEMFATVDDQASLELFRATGWSFEIASNENVASSTGVGIGGDGRRVRRDVGRLTQMGQDRFR